MSWREVGPNTAVYLLEYEAEGFGRTNCLAIRVAEGFVIMSPASQVSDADFRWLEVRAPICAMMEPHAGHTLGLRDWLERVPRTPVYAAPGSIERLAKVTKATVKPLEQFRTASKDLTFIVAPGTADRNILVEVRRGTRPIVYADELLIYLGEPPKSLLPRLFFFLNGVGKGFQVNRNYARMFVKDVKALGAAILQLLKNNPLVIFAHGPVRATPKELTETMKLLRSV